MQLKMCAPKEKEINADFCQQRFWAYQGYADNFIKTNVQLATES